MDGTRSIDEDAFEALLAGRPAPAQAAPLQAFTLAVRAASASQGRASAELAEMIATGRLMASDPSARTVLEAPGPARAQASRTPTRRRPTMLITHAITAALAKVAAAGTIAQATAGVALVAAGVTGAGAAGMLPAAAQDRFAAVVQHVSPLQVPTSTGTSGTDEATPADDATTAPTSTLSSLPTTTEPTTGTTTSTDPTTAPTRSTGSGDGPTAPVEDPATAATPKNFGGAVSVDARDGGVDGQAISQQAHARNEARATARATSASTPTSAPTAPTGAGQGRARRAPGGPATTPEPSTTAPGHSHS